MLASHLTQYLALILSIAFGLASFVVMGKKLWHYRIIDVQNKASVPELQKLLRMRDLKTAISTCKKHAQSYLAQLACVALEEFEDTKDFASGQRISAAQRAMDRVIERVQLK